MPITIVLPTHNDAHFLTKAIPSCFHQDAEVEVIVIDDASTVPFPDEVKHLIESNPKIKLIRHEQNKGLAGARNTAIREAKYDLIVPLDADDWFHPNVLGRMHRNMNRDVDVVYGDVFDNTLHKPKPQPFSKAMFLQDNPLFCSSLFRKAIWERVGGYMERQGPHYEDWNFWARCYKAGARFKYLPLTIYTHLSRPDGMLRILHPEREKYVKIATEGVFD